MPKPPNSVKQNKSDVFESKDNFEAVVKILRDMVELHKTVLGKEYDLSSNENKFIHDALARMNLSLTVLTGNDADEEVAEFNLPETAVITDTAVRRDTGIAETKVTPAPSMAEKKPLVKQQEQKTVAMPAPDDSDKAFADFEIALDSMMSEPTQQIPVIKRDMPEFIADFEIKPAAKITETPKKPEEIKLPAAKSSASKNDEFDLDDLLGKK